MPREYTEEQWDLALACGVPIECIPENYHQFGEHELTIQIEENLKYWAILHSSPLYALLKDPPDV